MPEFVFTEDFTGRELSFFGDNPPDQATVEGAFKNYDALKVASTGPKGSEERRRAMSQEVAAQQASSSEDTTSQRGRLSSAGQSFMRGGGVGVGQSVSDTVRTLESIANPANLEFAAGNTDFSEAVAAESGAQPMRQRTALEREQLVQGNPIYESGVNLSTGSKLAYQPNPKYKGEFFADVIPSSAGAMVPTIAASIVNPAAGAALYGLSAGQQAAEDAIASGRPETAQTASIATLPIGALSEFGLGAAANVGKLAKLGVQRGALVAAGRASAGEALQEGVEQVGGNLIASDVAGYDPNRGAFEGVPQAMAAGALLGGVIGGASAKIAQANTTPDLLAGLSEKWKAIGLARELNTLAPVGGISQPAPLTQGLLPQAQLDLSAQNAPPQFQMVSSPLPARGVSPQFTEAGLREQVAPEGQTPIDQLLSRPTQAQPAAAQLAQLEQSRQSQFPAGGAAVQPEQPQSIQPQGDLMSRLRDARKMDELRQPSPMSAAQLGTGQPVGGPPASNDLTPFLMAYEAQGKAPAPVAPAAPEVVEPPARPAKSKNVNLRAKSPKSKKSSQTIIGSNVQTGTEMPVQPPAGEAIDAATQAELQELDELMLKRGQAQNKVNGVSFTKKDEARFKELVEKNRGRIREQVDPAADPIVGTDINGIQIRQSAAGTYYTFENGRVRTGPSFSSEPISRSNPAAAQGVATEGVGVSSDEETPAFGVRRYGDALFISIAQYNRLRPLVDERLAAGDEVAKRVDAIEINAEREVAKTAGFGALTPEGQEQAVGNFKTKLYQSVAKWLAGGEFEFSSPVIAKSIAMDIGKSKAERMRKSVQSGESSEEDGVETRGAFEKVSEAVLPQEPLKAPPKVREEIILSMVNLQRQLGATKTQFGNVMMAYKDPSFAENLDDEELAILEQARPMLGRLDNLKFSVSSLIREPIGLARAQQAVEKWKLETGATEARIQVVDDPELTTPDGRPVAAMVETRPGELPLITINAAHIASEAEVREKLWHEALHPVWNDPSVQKAWGGVVNALPRGAVQAELARGYDPLEATMEAAINSASVQANNTPARTAWQKFLDAVWEAMGRVFGFQTKPKDFEQLMESALQSLSRPYNQAPATNYANQPDNRRSSKRNSLRVRISRKALTDLALSQASWRDWYKEHQDTLDAFFGSDAGLFQKILAITSQAASVKANVGLALKAFSQFKQGLDFDGKTRGEESSGYLPAVIGNLNALRAETQIQGRKIGAYTSANEGQTDAVVVDRHIARMLFGVDAPSAAQFAKAARVLTEIANELGWEPRQVQAALWAASIVKSGKQPQSYGQYIRSLHSNGTLKDRIGHVVDGSSAVYGASGGGVPDAGGGQAAAGGDGSVVRYSVANSFAMAKNPEEIQQRLETSSDPESLLAMGRAVASLITPEFQELVKGVEDAKPGTPEAAMRTFLKRAGEIARTGETVVEWGQTHQTPIPSFRSVGDLPAEWQGVVGNAMTGAHFALGQQIRSIDRAIEKTAGELTRVGADFSEADEQRLVAEATKSEAKRLLKDLTKLIEVERNKLGTSSAKASSEEVARAAQMVGKVDRSLIAALANGIEIMAREMPIGGFASNEEALKWLVERQSKNPIFGDKAMEAYFSLTEALKRKPDLTKRIEQIRALTLDNVDAVRQVGELGKLLGKNKANTIKTYAKLRADYESAFRQFKGLSDTMDRLSNRMDGLLRAKEALVKLTSSPEYNAKLADVFGNGKTMLSGLMAQMVERGQPTGVVEFYGPSAYKANGGIKTGGNVGVYGDPSFDKRDGLIYRIDWKPDFAAERKNAESIEALLYEITDALGNPESKNYLTDPLARASYERVKNYVGQFLVDNRYLTEQQWSDSFLLKGMKLGGVSGGLPGIMMQAMGRLYTTRMNAARVSGGRGGVAWEESNKAVDSFEKKSENTLRDTRTENAVARRAAIESHQLNPDDPMDVETWSAHISSVLGSMQNPSQDQLKEGDYVGGLQVTKEDLRSARIQKDFSSGVVRDFNNMATSFAEVVNPEEEIGGILFTRAAEDYGMKTSRQFSAWGRDFSELWKIATEKDLKAFQVKQDSATGKEPVGMVWDEREKLADQFVSGPVHSHISETNSEFTSGDSSQLRSAFAKIRKDLKAGRLDGLRTINDIASSISSLTADENGEGGLNILEAKEALLKAVDRDVVGYLRASDDYAQSDIGGSNLPNAIMSVKAANGALAKARGKMVAPTWFYDYGIHDDYKRAGEVANGKRILLMKVYETMTAYRGAVSRRLDEAKREIRENAAKMGRDGKPVGLAKAEREYDKEMARKYDEGSVFATRRGLEETLRLVDNQLEGLRGHLAISSRLVEEQSLAIRGIRSFVGGFGSVLLSNGNSIINNLSSTTLDTYRTWQMTNRYGAGLSAIARSNGRLMRFVASDLFSMLPASLRGSLTKRRKIMFLDTVAKTLEGLMDERQLMEANGLISSFESYSSIYRRIKANPLTFGATRSPATSMTERLMSQLYSKAAFAVAMGTWVRERSPGYFDSLLNRVIATDANQFTEWLTPHLLKWARSLPGETKEEKMDSARQSTITPESLGVTKEGLALIRDYMMAAGSLEAVAIKALDRNGLTGLTVPNVLTNEERVGIQTDAGRKYNTRASSTSPDIAKGGAGVKGLASNVLHMFMGWVLQRMGSDATQFLKFKGGGWKKEAEIFWKIIQLFFVTLLAGALYKVPKDIWRFMTGNPATTPNILQAIESPEMALRYLATSTAGVFPVAGQVVGELLGGTGISSPLNNNVLDNNPLAGFLASVLSTAQRTYQTGDLKYPLVDFTRKNFWPAGVMLNYAMPGDVEARGASRAVRMGAAGMEVRPVGGGIGARETPTTPLVRDAVAALYEGDTAGYQKAREKFIAYQVGQGKTQKEAEKRFDSSVSGRDPLRSVLGRTPTEDEEATIIRRLTPGQRSTVTKARSLFRKPKKIGLGRAKLGRRVRLGRKRPARRRVRLRKAGA